MMISKEELEIIKYKIEENKEKVKAFQAKVKGAEKVLEELEVTRQMLQVSKHDAAKEKNDMAKELSNVKSIISSYKSGETDDEKQIQILKKNLLSLEDVLAQHVEKVEVAQNLQDMLEDKAGKIQNKDNELYEKVEKLDKVVKKYHNYKKNKFPRSAPVLLRVVDLESSLNFYAQEIFRVNSLIKCQKQAIEKLEDEQNKKKAELLDVTTNLDNSLIKIKSNDEERVRLYSDLSNLNSDFNNLNIERKEVDDNFQKNLNNYRAEDTKSLENIAELREKLFKLNQEVSSIPDVTKRLTEEQSMAILKKKQTALEIQKKIDAALLEIMQRNNKSPKVMKLSTCLEQHWKEFEDLGVKATNLERRLYKSQDLLQRKKTILEETKKQVSKKQEKPGIAHLNRFYEEESSENRKLGNNMRNVKRDLEIYESEEAQFMRELEELKNS